MSTCSRLDLQTLGSQPVMPENLPDHWSKHDPKVEKPKTVNDHYNYIWYLVYTICEGSKLDA